jgi:NAD(P)H-hydrate repair Nnr-like enzyme with NAD(P)H-hydrate dehydratase domain/NAD(P)H-hydrate repair Nnr-like enzyme with NAD(P)H-hydrate epimerase domain
MQRAAWALAGEVRRELAEVGIAEPGARIALLVGAGNNGGDALWCGAYLARRGCRVTAYLAAASVHPEGLEAFLEARGVAVAVHSEDELGLGDIPVGSAGAAGSDSRQPEDSQVSPRTGAIAWVGHEATARARSGAAVTTFRLIGPAEAAAEACEADVVVDGLLGIGNTGAMRGIPGDLVTALNAIWEEDAGVGGVDHGSGSRGGGDGGPVGGRVGQGTAGSGGDDEPPARPLVIAVDTPSGIGIDDGTVPGPVLRADRTVTFGAVKPGLLLPPATHLAGAGTLVDIGLTFPGSPLVTRLSAQDVAALWRVPTVRDHKYTRGVVGVVAGTSAYPGAAVLCASAAVLTGAGMVRYSGPQDVARTVIAARPEVVNAWGQVQALVVGPGIPACAPGVEEADDGQWTRARACLKAGFGHLAGTQPAVPVVVDAGGLSLVSGDLPAWVVLTPHAGELAVLLRAHGESASRADVEAEPLRWARRAQEITGATVLLKGAATVVVGPGETAYCQANAPAWMATAGSGDVLAGLVGTTLAARSAEVVANPSLAAEVAAAAVLVHGFAGELANPGGPVAALAVAEALPHVIAELLLLR